MKRIAHITDIHLNEQDPVNLQVNSKKNWEKILKNITEENISDIVFGGDIGNSSAHKWFFTSLNKFSYTLCLGNHDQYKNVAKHFKRSTPVKNVLCYVEENEVFRQIYFDTSAEFVSYDQLEWMKQQLHTIKKIIIFMHHPVLMVNTPIDRAYPLKNRDEVRNCLLNSKKDITIFCGHLHLADEQRLDNVRQIITPASSYQVVKNATEVVEDGSMFGYRIIEINGDNIESRVKMFNNERVKK